MSRDRTYCIRSAQDAGETGFPETQVRGGRCQPERAVVIDLGWIVNLCLRTFFCNLNRLTSRVYCSVKKKKNQMSLWNHHGRCRYYLNVLPWEGSQPCGPHEHPGPMPVPAAVVWPVAQQWHERRRNAWGLSQEARLQMDWRASIR